MREKLRSATAQIDKIPPSIEDLEAGEQLDLIDLQRLLLKDKELVSNSRKGFEDDEEDDEEIDYEEEQLNEMMRARFNRNRVVASGKWFSGIQKNNLLFDNDDDEMQGFEDLDDELDD